jgi:hypothetical protein
MSGDSLDAAGVSLLRPADPRRNQNRGEDKYDSTKQPSGCGAEGTIQSKKEVEHEMD